MHYRLLMFLLMPLALLWMLVRSRREPAWRRGWEQRFGYLPVRQDRPLWIHAASVGEVNSAASLVRQLAGTGLPLQLSAFTPTGVQRWRELLPGTPVALLPLDLAGATRRALRRLGPRGLLLLEAELWPQLLLSCRQAEVPVGWLSARISERSSRRMAGLLGRRLLRRSLSAVTALGAQSTADAERFGSLGVSASGLDITGSLKADLNLPPGLIEDAGLERQGWARAVVWLAASTHEGEEAAAIGETPYRYDGDGDDGEEESSDFLWGSP